MESLMNFPCLSEALGGRLFNWEGKQDSGQGIGGFSSVCIDSRAALPGALFVALKGCAQDGHLFVEDAFRAGAAGALVAIAALNDPSFGIPGLAKKWGRVLVAVEDTLKGLQDAAAAYLRKFPKLIRIGITGSSGKTTTKEIAAAIIGREKQVVLNKGNLNSETGLPLSIFEVRSHHEVGIFEAGMNRKGEIAELAKVLDPCIALITNIGSAHIGILGSIGAIAEEKKNIFSQFTGANIAMIADDEKYRDFLAEGIRGRAVFYGASSLPALGRVKDLGLFGTEITWEGEAIRFGLPGKFNLRNALAAAAIAIELPVSSRSIREGLESVKPLFGRGEILAGRSTIIRDCYNSNPESAGSVLDYCDSLDWPGRKVYVMGSMLELGGISEEAHAALGARLLESKGDMVFLYGDEMAAAAEALRGSAQNGIQDGIQNGAAGRKVPFFFSRDIGELSRALDDYVHEGDLVLLKGSRGCALESLTGILAGGDTVFKGESHVS